MSFAPPDAQAVAHAEIAKLRANPGMIEAMLVRQEVHGPAISLHDRIGDIEAFHRERMQKVPSTAKYPEAAGWVDHQLRVDELVRQGAGLSNGDLAVYRSMRAYLQFRGYETAVPTMADTEEKCRVAWIPDTDRGRLHIKNVDSTMPPGWKHNRPKYHHMPTSEPLMWDGSGNGLHMDDEPEEIFPLPVKAMCLQGCTTVAQATEFLERYMQFWSSGNIVLHDHSGEAVVVEKPSCNFIQFHRPDSNGRVWASGMVVRDLDSPMGRYFTNKRQQYLDRFGKDEDSSDVAAWRSSRELEKILADFISQPGTIKADEAFALFRRPTTEGGLNKDGAKFHPDQPELQYTNVSHGTLVDERRTLRYERDVQTKRMPEAPEDIHWDA